jgi:ABC-type branched-subunit amino acid transport system ATPase component
MCSEALVTAVRLNNVVVTYGRRVVLDIQFLDIAESECVGLFGSNGSGKSTLLKVFAGLLRPSRGAVLLGGNDVTVWPTSQRARHCRLGYMAQAGSIFMDLTVAENVGLAETAARRYSKVGPQSSMHQLVAELEPICSEVRPVWERLVARSKARASDLSGGERRLLALLMVLLQKPSILLLDEPLAGIAPSFKEMVLQFVTSLRGAGVTVVVAEQNIAETLQIVSRSLVLRSGVIQYDGEPGVLDEPNKMLSML